MGLLLGAILGTLTLGSSLNPKPYHIAGALELKSCYVRTYFGLDTVWGLGLEEKR